MTNEDTAVAEPEEAGGLRAIWANTLVPVAPLPWYRRVPLKLAAAGVVVVGLATALTVAAVTGAGAPTRHRIVLGDELGHQVRMPEDGDLRATHADYQSRMTALRPYRELTVAGYGTAGTSTITLTVVGLTGTYSDPLRELDIYFDRLAWREQTGGSGFGATLSTRLNFPSGPLGGLLDCAELVRPTASETTCAWADGSTVGIVVDRTGSLGPADLAARTLEVRAAVEVEAKG
ncbi:hypothetical protein GCM10018790_37860 [Kitasatospora xanthocidica]|uniref:hypothetical protein n=1 Tax=Kitasatospora xanthocidica TaxID=83382 RepID=UPI001675D301|nr:hypothetical protein [Kitasatospora xanthocidica]GHF56294.1 hypothetical protein GCM10018790_37860 [Kitasatospora xanthocidica]